MKIKRLVVAGLLLILGCFAIGLFNYAVESPSFLWQRELLVFFSFSIVYGMLGWFYYKVDKRNWLWLTLCGFCLLMIPVFSVFDLPIIFWIPCLMACLAFYGYFVNKQMAKAIIVLAFIGVAVLILAVIVQITGIGVTQSYA
jgi:hypothetical protein